MTTEQYEKHIAAVCDQIVAKANAGAVIDPAAVNARLEARNPANWPIHALCAKLRVPGFHGPRHEPALASAAAVRVKMVREIQNVIDKILTWHRSGSGDAGAAGLHFAMHVDVGLGKSSAVRREVHRFISEARAAGSPHRVLWLVPHHRLADETLKEFRLLGIKAVVWRGRDTIDPVSGQTMCRDLDAINEAQAVHADVGKTVCGTQGGPQCPFRGGCQYLQQKQAAASADVIIAANNALFVPIPISVSDFGFVVVDEGFWQRGVQKKRDISLSSLASDIRRNPVLANGATDPSGTIKLYGWCTIVERAAAAAADNEFLTSASFNGLLTIADAQAAAKLEWARKVDTTRLLRPTMSAADREAALDKAAVNRTLSRRAEMWRAIEAMFSGAEDGRLQKIEQRSSSGVQAKLALYGRRQVHEDIARLPILHLDATLALDQVRAFLPHMRLTASLRAATPHQHVTQVLPTVDKKGLPTGGFGKTSVLPTEGGTAEDRRRARRIRNIRDYIRLQVGDGTGLVITYHGAEAEFAGIPGVDVAHFNAIAGLDSFGSVDCLFVIGRPLATEHTHRDHAVALTGMHPEITELTDVVDYILMRDGRGEPMSRKGFVDPSLESIRRAITDAEVIQAVGRARGVNRTADNPARIFVLNDVVLPFSVDTLTSWREITPDVVEKMLGRGAALLSPSDACRVYPDLFCSEEAAKKALRRAQVTRGQTPIITTYMDLSPSAFLIRYQARGARQKKREALCMPGRIDWLRDQLEQVHGPLACFEVTGMQAPVNHEKDAEDFTDEPTATTAIIDLAETRRNRCHAATEQAPQYAVSMGETIREWSNARLASLSYTRVQVETHPQKAA